MGCIAYDKSVKAAVILPITMLSLRTLVNTKI